MTNGDKDLKQQLIELAWEIEKLPASEQQTKVITMLTDIRSKATPQQPSEPLKELDEDVIINEFNIFIKKWTGNNYPHLIDSDENDGERFRDFLRYYRKPKPSEKKALSVDIEELAAETHKIYCEAYEKRFGKPYWTNGDYSKLDEPTKEYDRHFVRWAIKRFALPAQREVRYPEKMDHDHSCEFDCKGCVDSGWNQAIDEFKKLNGG